MHRSIRQPVLVIGITSDALYPLEMQKELVAFIPRAQLRVIHSVQGHDGFLLESASIGAYVAAFLTADAGAPGYEAVRAPRPDSPIDAGGGVRRLVSSLPRSVSAMNAALAKETKARALSKPSESRFGGSWFFGI